MKLFCNYFLIIFFCFEIFAVQETADEYYIKGCAFLKKSECANAVDFFENAVNLDKEYFFIMAGNGFFEILLKQNNTEISKKVIQICEHVIKNKESVEVDGLVYYYLGWAEITTGQKEAAKTNLLFARKMMNQEGLNSEMIDILLETIN